MNSIIKTFLFLLIIKILFANGIFYIKTYHDDIDMNLLAPNVFNVDNLHKCLRYCDKESECNIMITIMPNTCKSYNILKYNFCLNNISSLITYNDNSIMYKKSKKTNSKTCKESKECLTEGGLECTNNKCVCNKTR